MSWRTLLIDDMRDFPADRVARTGEDGIVALRNEGPWDLLYLDHDLGEGKTGYDVVCWLEQNIEQNIEFLPERVIIVSSNPVGRKNIEAVLRKFYVQDGYIWLREVE